MNPMDENDKRQAGIPLDADDSDPMQPPHLNGTSNGASNGASNGHGERSNSITDDLALTGIAGLSANSEWDEINVAVEAFAQRAAASSGTHAELLISAAIDVLLGLPVNGAERIVTAAVKVARDRAKARARRERVAANRNAVEEGAHVREVLPDNVVADSDLANAHRLSRDHGEELRHCAALGWYVWSETGWSTGRSDREVAVMQRMEDVVRGLDAYAGQLLIAAAHASDDATAAKLRAQAQLFTKWAQRSQSLPRMKAALELAASLPDIAASTSDFDRDPWLLNVGNGTLELGGVPRLREHRRSDLLTKIAGADYDPNATAPTWLRFLERVLPDPEVRAFVQRALGYSLSGDVGEQCLFICHGPGANGKSTALETVRHVLRDYAAHAQTDTFMRVGQRGADNDLARLRGARFVTCIESGEARKLDEERIKQLTGGDTITARFLYHEPFEFRPALKLWVACNDKPRVSGNDDAIWRRLKLIPFEVQIPEAERDGTLPERLRMEAAGILAWMVEGCAEWQRGGLRPPAAVVAQSAQWRADENEVGRFIDECCVVADFAKVQAGALYEAYRKWAQQQGDDVLTQNAFGRRLTGLGHQQQRSRATRGWIGIGIRSDAEEDDQ
jgi:putative DNA primase/helicase